MVPPEEACSDKVGNDHVYGIVIMSEEDAEHAHDAEGPTSPVIAPEASRRVCETKSVPDQSVYDCSAVWSLYVTFVQKSKQ